MVTSRSAVPGRPLNAVIRVLRAVSTAILLVLPLAKPAKDVILGGNRRRRPDNAKDRAAPAAPGTAAGGLTGYMVGRATLGADTLDSFTHHCPQPFGPGKEVETDGDLARIACSRRYCASAR